MTTANVHDRLRTIAVADETTDGDLAAAVRTGLDTDSKWLPCRFFYDADGSRLFELICELPEYYLTRTEHEILRERADEIVELCPGHPSLVELGSGSSTKTRVVIEAFLRRHGRLRYVPVDISRSILEESALALLDDYAGLEIVAIAAEYRQALHRLRKEETTSKLVLWLGSSVGNFTREAAVRFLSTVCNELSARDRLLIGVDLRKERAVLEAAYHDRAGVTARFNKNVLARINRELGADFDLSLFEHRAVYKKSLGRVEIHLRSTRMQTVHIDSLDLDIAFERGETIHTENSYKYSTNEIGELARRAGMRIERQWFDADRRFSANLLAPECSG